VQKFRDYTNVSSPQGGGVVPNFSEWRAEMAEQLNCGAHHLVASNCLEQKLLSSG